MTFTNGNGGVAGWLKGVLTAAGGILLAALVISLINLGQQFYAMRQTVKQVGESVAQNSEINRQQSRSLSTIETRVENLRDRLDRRRREGG